MLAEGAMLPPAELLRPNGTCFALADMPRPFALFFFPRADTPGCTSEARDFDALMPRCSAIGASLLGISRDPPAKLARFRDKYALTVPLASDPGALTDMLGLWGEKTLYGRTYMGLERATIVVGTDGRIVRIWRKVKVAGHAESIAVALAEITR